MEGNKMKMREALARIALRFSVDGLGRHWIRLNEHDWQLIQSALYAPARNCDVGTAAEQERRYKATGEAYHTSTLTDALAWSQMPYEAKEGAWE